MRISDWSSDVCSSDLPPWPQDRLAADAAGRRVQGGWHPAADRISAEGAVFRSRLQPVGARAWHCLQHAGEIPDPDPGGLPRHLLAEADPRSEEHTSELQSLMRISYAVFCLKKKQKHNDTERERYE